MENVASTIVTCPTCAKANRVPTSRLGDGGECGQCGSALFKNAALFLTNLNFEAHATRSDIPLLVDFWAPWCGPCRQMAPHFEEAARLLEPRVRLGKLDIEAEQAIVARYGVRSIPTMILFAKGREIARQSGGMPAAAIVRWTEEAIA